MKWILVKKEQPPKDGTKFIGAMWNKYYETWDIAILEWWDESFKVIPTRDYRLNFTPTHWAKIEEPS